MITKRIFAIDRETRRKRASDRRWALKNLPKFCCACGSRERLEVDHRQVGQDVRRTERRVRLRRVHDRLKVTTETVNSLRREVRSSLWLEDEARRKSLRMLCSNCHHRAHELELRSDLIRRLIKPGDPVALGQTFAGMWAARLLTGSTADLRKLGVRVRTAWKKKGLARISALSRIRAAVAAPNRAL